MLTARVAAGVAQRRRPAELALNLGGRRDVDADAKTLAPANGGSQAPDQAVRHSLRLEVAQDRPRIPFQPFSTTLVNAL
jgi:hypothetical protein